MTACELSTGSTSVSPAFSTVSTDSGRFLGGATARLLPAPTPQADTGGEHAGRKARAGQPSLVGRRTAPLTPVKTPAYNRRALPPNPRGTLRRKREEDLPAQYSEACEDARLPRKNGHAWRTRCSGCSSSQGTQGPVGVVLSPIARTGRGSHEDDQVVSGDRSGLSDSGQSGSSPADSSHRTDT